MNAIIDSLVPHQSRTEKIERIASAGSIESDAESAFKLSMVVSLMLLFQLCYCVRSIGSLPAWNPGRVSDEN